MNNQITSLNIKMLWPVKQALIEYARSQGESVSVVVRRVIKNELVRQGFLHIEKNVELYNHQEKNLVVNHTDNRR